MFKKPIQNWERGRVALQNTACANKKTNFVLQPCLKGVGDSKKHRAVFLTAKTYFTLTAIDTDHDEWQFV